MSHGHFTSPIGLFLFITDAVDLFICDSRRMKHVRLLPSKKIKEKTCVWVSLSCFKGNTTFCILCSGQIISVQYVREARSSQRWMLLTNRNCFTPILRQFHFIFLPFDVAASVALHYSMHSNLHWLHWIYPNVRSTLSLLLNSPTNQCWCFRLLFLLAQFKSR